VLEPATLRPHVVKARNSRYLIFTGDGEDFIDISEEVRMTVFEWPDLPELATPEFFLE